jgi:hypothetical protein
MALLSVSATGGHPRLGRELRELLHGNRAFQKGMLGMDAQMNEARLAMRRA